MHMRLSTVLNEVAVDNVKGWGATPNNQEVDYFGMRVKMKPSVFLKLALPLDETPSEAIRDHITGGGAIAAPFFDIQYPPEWEDRDFSNDAVVKSHEGRNRMHAILETEGDVPVEVHLFFRGGVRARDLTPEIKERLNASLMSERSRGVVQGPLFVEM
jgi:hypothetical protein